MIFTDFLALHVRRAGGIDALADCVDVDVTTLRRWLRGDLCPRSEHVAKLAAITDTPEPEIALAVHRARLARLPRKPLAVALPVSHAPLWRAS